MDKLGVKGMGSSQQVGTGKISLTLLYREVYHPTKDHTATSADLSGPRRKADPYFPLSKLFIFVSSSFLIYRMRLIIISVHMCLEGE